MKLPICESVIKNGIFLPVVIGCLSILYLAQVASPLRLTPDAVAYLSLADSFLEGQGFLYRGAATHFPPGYPALLALLIYLGMGFSGVFIGTNLIFLALGHTIFFYIAATVFNFKKNTLYIIICVCLLSSVFILNVPFPLSDIMFYRYSNDEPLVPGKG